jgi:hypothetical protein
MRIRRMLRMLALTGLLGAAACGENEGGAIGDEQTDVGEGTTGIAQPGDGLESTTVPPATDSTAAGGGAGTGTPPTGGGTQPY